MDYQLYYVRGSPWSVRVVWFHSLLPASLKKDVKLVEAGGADKIASKVKGGENYLNPASGLKILTLPTLFFREDGKLKYINDGIEIVKFLAQKASHLEPDSFASKQLENLENVVEWNNKTDVGMRYARLLFVTAPDNFVKYVVPGFLNYIPLLTRTITKGAQKGLRTKYHNDEAKNVKPEEVEAIIEQVNGILESQNYILGDEFSYADVSFAVMLDAVLPYDLKKPLDAFGALTPMSVKETKKIGWEAKYPQAFALRTKVMKENLQEEVIKSVGIQPKKKIVEAN